MHRLAMLFILLITVLLIGCTDDEIVKNVRLESRDSTENIKVSLSDPKVFRFGFDLRLSPKEDVAIYLPFLRYLEQKTDLKFTLDFTAKYQDTVKNLGEGITSFAALGPVNCILAQNKYGIDCLVAGLNKDGSSQYKAVIITRMDSSLHKISDLDEHSFAFGDRFSTQGHVIPRKMLADVGINLDSLSRFTYTGSHAATVRAVLNGEYDAGGVQDALAWRLVDEGIVRALAVSKPYPSSQICYSSEVSEKQIRIVKNALLEFDPKGHDSANLKNWDRTEMASGFAPSDIHALKEIESLVIQYGLIK